MKKILQCRLLNRDILGKSKFKKLSIERLFKIAIMRKFFRFASVLARKKKVIRLMNQPIIGKANKIYMTEFFHKKKKEKRRKTLTTRHKPQMSFLEADKGKQVRGSNNYKQSEKNKKNKDLSRIPSLTQEMELIDPSVQINLHETIIEGIKSFFNKKWKHSLLLLKYPN